jgi:HEAT repeat protein
MRLLNLLVSLSSCLLVCLPGRADDVIDSPMYRTPAIPVARVVKTFPDGMMKLWLQALERPESDYKANAAIAIAAAHERGLKGLEASVDPLRRELAKPDIRPVVRTSIVRALVALDARHAAPDLLKLTDSGDADLSELIVPALARWDYKPARAGWLEQLHRPPYRRATVLAIQALARVGEEKAAPALRELALSDEASMAVRLEAARALSEPRADAEVDAERLMSGGLGPRLIAATLLGRASGDAAVAPLLNLAKDPEPAIAKNALIRLVYGRNAGHVVPLLESVLANPDAIVRGLGVEILLRQPSAEHVRLLGTRLDDPHPDVRLQARRALRELAAKAEWREPVLREATRMLEANDWRGHEQSAILLAQLGHRPAADGLLKRLTSDRPEVCIAAAWALRQLAVPDSLPAALDHFNRTLRGNSGVPATAVDPQLCQLAQFFGQVKYEPADSTLRALIPPRTAGPETRAAAIWALGHLHAGQPDAEIARACEGRIRAVVPGDLEDNRVRRMSATALGLMKAKDSLGTLREFYRDKRLTLDMVQNACAWSISQMTGEPVLPGIVESQQSDWFLVPAK